MGIIIRPSLLAFPISMFVLFISFCNIYLIPDFGTQLLMALLLVLPLFLILFIATRGRKYHIKGGYVHIKLFSKYPFSVKIDSLSGVGIKPVGIRAGHLQLKEKGAVYFFESPTTLHNIAFPMRVRKLINFSTLNGDLANRNSINWLTSFFEQRRGVVKPTIRAYPWMLSILIMFFGGMYAADYMGIHLVIFIMFGMPMLIVLLVSYSGTRYELKDGIVTAFHLLKRNKQIKLDELESLDLELIGLMAGHITLKNSNGVVINMNNIPVRLTAK